MRIAEGNPQASSDKTSGVTTAVAISGLAVILVGVALYYKKKYHSRGQDKSITYEDVETGDDAL